MDQAIIGRAELRERLSPFAVCTLLLAPHSTGKRTLALAVARDAGVVAPDLLAVPQPYWVTAGGGQVDPAEVAPGTELALVEPELSTADVRDLIAWARIAPRTSAGKVAVVRLGHATDRARSGVSRPVVWSASPRVQSMMLKLLEEPPPGVCFVLTAVSGVLPTIASRAVVLTAGLLAAPDVARILDRVSDLPLESCRRVAALGDGRVRPALARAASTETELARVRGVLAALARSDAETVATAASDWTTEASELLRVWSQECAAGRWRVFGPADAVLPRAVAWRLAQVIATWSGVRPRLLLAGVASSVGL